MGKKADQRRAAKEKAIPVLNLIDHILSQLATPNEKRGFLAKIHRQVYDRRKPLYQHGLHPNQKS